MNQIFFWAQRDQYGAFSNFFYSPIKIGDWTYPTVEHFYQAQKFVHDYDKWLAVACASTPMRAKHLSHKFGKDRRTDWEDVKFDIMVSALIVKFNSHPKLKELLLGTGDAEIYEDSPKDKIWGTGEKGGVGTGQNLLGKALMQVREMLR